MLICIHKREDLYNCVPTTHSLLFSTWGSIVKEGSTKGTVTPEPLARFQMQTHLALSLQEDRSLGFSLPVRFTCDYSLIQYQEVKL